MPHTSAAPRHRPGRGSQVGARERGEIQLGALTENLTISELARTFGRSRGTIRALLARDDYKEARWQLQSDLIAEAKDILAGGVALAARSWNTAVEVAGERGRHEPARDLLLAQRVIEPATTERAPTVQIQLNPGAIGYGLPQRSGPILIDATRLPPEDARTS